MRFLHLALLILTITLSAHAVILDNGDYYLSTQDSQWLGECTQTNMEESQINGSYELDEYEAEGFCLEVLTSQPDFASHS